MTTHNHTNIALLTASLPFIGTTAHFIAFAAERAVMGFVPLPQQYRLVASRVVHELVEQSITAGVTIGMLHGYASWEVLTGIPSIIWNNKVEAVFSATFSMLVETQGSKLFGIEDSETLFSKSTFIKGGLSATGSTIGDYAHNVLEPYWASDDSTSNTTSPVLDSVQVPPDNAVAAGEVAKNAVEDDFDV